MKINFVAFGLDCCGGNRAIFEVCNRLIDRGHEVTITTSEHAKLANWFSPVQAEIISVTEMGVMKLFRKCVMPPEWNYDKMSALAESVPDCDVNVSTFSLTAYPTLKSGKGKMFSYIQNIDSVFLSNPYEIMLSNLSYELPMQKLVVSHWLQHRLGDSTYVGNGVNLSTFHPMKHHSSDLSVVFSRLRGMNWKGDEDVMIAMNQVQKRLSNVRHVALRKENIVSDEALAVHYNCADVFVSAPWTEGFGLYNLEAMACGTPVVTTDCLGTRDYVKDGYNASVVRTHDPNMLAEAVIQVLQDEKYATQLIAGGLETAQKFSWETVVDRIENAFLESLS